MKRRILLISVVCILIALGWFIFFGVGQLRHFVESQNCGNQMVAICYAARVWAGDHDGHYPSDFTSMSNELGTTRILICPSDKLRVPAKDWTSLTSSNSSYEIITPGITLTNFDTPFLRCKVDGQLGYCDGTFFDGKRRRTKW
jgi:hypothetical protein